MRQHHTIIGTIVLTTLAGFSGLPICCDGGYEYRHRNVVPVAEAKTDERDARIAALEKDRQRQMAETAQLQEQIAGLQRKLAARPEQPLAKAYDDLLALLRSEIDRGNIVVHQSGDQITINLADRLLFASGEDQLKPAGGEVLRQVGSVLKTVPDRHMRVSGHTDNIPIGGRLLERFPTNTALSRARATHAAQALEENGVKPDNVNVEGYGESRPLASNATEEGRRKNRRMEIVVLSR